MSVTVVIPVTPTLLRKDNSVISLTDLASITGFLSVHAANAYATLGSLPDAAEVNFTIKDLTPGEYDFYAVETDKQVPARVSAPSNVVTFVVPAVVLADPAPPTVGVPVIS